MTNILLILIAWLVKMPLWLSIIITIFSGIGFIFKIIEIAQEI